MSEWYHISHEWIKLYLRNNREIIFHIQTLSNYKETVKELELPKNEINKNITFFSF